MNRQVSLRLSDVSGRPTPPVRATVGAGVSHLLTPLPTDFFTKIETAVIDALWAVETNRGANIRPGDGGAARGHLQQHKGHWDRGCEYLGVDWPWPEDTDDFAKAKAVAIANWRRDAWGKIEPIVAEELARRFRLPNDPYRAGNDAYWKKVKKELTTENAEVQR